jgi:ligand-binding sensor protein
MRYIEKGVEVLSALENANALGRIFAHEQDITTYLLENLTPSLYVMYTKIRKSFMGHITFSATDVHTRHPRGMLMLGQSIWENDQEIRDQLVQKEQDECDMDNFCPPRSPRSRSQCPIPVRRNIPLHVHVRKRCHHCHKWGHIRATCPTRLYQYLGHRK